MKKITLLFALSFLLSSCFLSNYYEKAEKLSIVGIFDGANEVRKSYDLVHVFDGDTVAGGNSECDENFKTVRDGHIMVYGIGFCNVLIGGGDIWGCNNRLRGNVLVEIFLKNKSTKKNILLTKRTIDMNAYYQTTLKTQVFFGSDTSRYVERIGANFDWNKAKQLVLKGTNDTIYHYTAWLWDKTAECDEKTPKEQCFVEIP